LRRRWVRRGVAGGLRWRGGGVVGGGGVASRKRGGGGEEWCCGGCLGGVAVSLKGRRWCRVGDWGGGGIGRAGGVGVCRWLVGRLWGDA